MSNTSLYWLCQIAGWGLHLLSILTVTAIYGDWSHIFVSRQIVFTLTGLLFSHLMRTMIQRVHVFEKSHGLQILYLSLFSVSFAFLVALIQVLIYIRFDLIYQEYRSMSYVENTLTSSVLNLWLFIPWNLIYFLFHYVQKVREQRARILRHERYEHELLIQKLEGEKARVEFQRKAIEMELQALRTQMNPHFIFNCLSSINHFIIKNESENASKYLANFSRLLRMVLNNSNKKQIPLEDELEMLELYLNMEKLRFVNSFEYNFIYENGLDTGAIYIPPLLLQPFAENAIWHGLMHKDGKGCLDIEVTLENEVYLTCTIVDNGIGRKKAEELSRRNYTKRKSVGIQTTKQRLSLLYDCDEMNDFFDVVDLVDESGEAIGTKVILKIKYLRVPEDADQ